MEDQCPAFQFTNNRLGVWDYVVFSLVLAISAGIGLFYGCTGGKQKTTGEFLMANREMSVVPTAMSLLASFMSAITLLGTPAEIYTYGTQYWFVWLSYVLMIPIAAHVTVPIFFRCGITSVFEYLERRFGSAVRIMNSIAFILQMTLYMAIVLYAPALAMNAVSGLNVWVSVFSMGIVCTFYTTLGGMKAVMWTDTFQMCIMFAGLIAILVQGSLDEGGFGNMWQYLVDGERVEFWNFDPDPTVRHTVWNLAFGGMATWLAIYGVNQAQVQRALTVPKLKVAQTALYLNMFGLTALMTLCALAGVVVYARYRHCDPLKTGQITASDQLLPLYVMDALGHMPGLAGLFTASLFSGALSTVSSGLNGLAAVTLEDIVKHFYTKKIKDERAALISKILAMCYGVICIALTFVAAQLGGALQAALGLFGMLGGPQLGIFLLGMLNPKANNKGAISGFLVGLAFTLWVGMGAQIYKPVNTRVPPVEICGCDFNYTLPVQTNSTDEGYGPGFVDIYKVSYMWYAFISVSVSFIIGTLVSFCTGPLKPDEIDSDLCSPIFDIFCWWLPEKTLVQQGRRVGSRSVCVMAL